MELGSVRPRDLEWVVEVVDGWACTQRWDLRGQTPPPAFLELLLWQQVLHQRVVRFSGGPIGLLQLVDVDLRNQVAHLELLIDGDRFAEAEPLLVQFVARCFGEFPLRKLYIAAASDALDPTSVIGSGVREIARLPCHQRRRATTYTDMVIHELNRVEVTEVAACRPVPVGL
jgi:hypothetical protein